MKRLFMVVLLVLVCSASAGAEYRYTIHLKSGKVIKVNSYEKVGSQIMLPLLGGRFGISEEDIDRIEEVGEGPSAVTRKGPDIKKEPKTGDEKEAKEVKKAEEAKKVKDMSPREPGTVIFTDETGAEPGKDKILKVVLVQETKDSLTFDVTYSYVGQIADMAKVGVYPDMPEWAVSEATALVGKHTVSIKVSLRPGAPARVESSSLRLEISGYKGENPPSAEYRYREFLGPLYRRIAPFPKTWTRGEYTRSGKQTEAKIKEQAEFSNKPEPEGYSVNISMYYLGRPLSEFTKVMPKFHLSKRGSSKFYGRNISYDTETGKLVITGLDPGKYNLYAHVNANGTNPADSPGDFQGGVPFDVPYAGKTRYKGIPFVEGEVSFAIDKVIHMTLPEDNGALIDKTGGACSDKTVLTNPVRIAWEPLAEGVNYSYTVRRCNCKHFDYGTVVKSGTTEGTSASLDLPPTGENEIYLLQLKAFKGAMQVGHLMTRAERTTAWDYRFRVQ